MAKSRDVTRDIPSTEGINLPPGCTFRFLCVLSESIVLKKAASYHIHKNSGWRDPYSHLLSIVASRDEDRRVPINCSTQNGSRATINAYFDSALSCT